MLELRNLELKDLLKVEQIHDANNKDFPMPQLDNGLYIIKKAVVKDGEVIGCCAVRLTSEVFLILDDEQSNVTKTKSIKEIQACLIKEIPATGLKDTHLFITPESDESYAKMLIDHFGFVRARGIPLYFEV